MMNISTNDTLTIAVIESSDSPLVLLDGHFNVIAASKTFGQTFHVDPVSIRGSLLFSVSAGAWDVPQLRSLLDASLLSFAKSDDQEMIFAGEGKNLGLLVNAHQLDHANAEQIRILLSLSVVTEAGQSLVLAEQNEKLKGALREKDILLLELQHRIANSLQIIASVINFPERIDYDRHPPPIRSAAQNVQFPARRRYTGVGGSAT